MTFNALTQTFAPLGLPPATTPAITEAYDGRTTAQLTANNAFTRVTVTTAATLVEAAKVRNSMLLVVPSDQQTVAVDNTNTIVGPSNAFNIPPGVSLILFPYTDPVYATVPQGTAVIFFMDS